MERSRSLAPRDQATSAFSTILMRLVDSSDATAAVLVDPDGETVDYAGSGDVYEMKIAAAEWRLVLSYVHAARIEHWQKTRELYFRGQRRSFAVIGLTDGYAIVLVLVPRSFGVSERAIDEAVRELKMEAGLDFSDPRRGRDLWVRVEVRTRVNDPRRPVAVWVEGAWTDLEVLGRYPLGDREVGYRARLSTGAELTLVREPLGRWYADVLPGA